MTEVTFAANSGKLQELLAFIFSLSIQSPCSQSYLLLNSIPYPISSYIHLTLLLLNPIPYPISFNIYFSSSSSIPLTLLLIYPIPYPISIHSISLAPPLYL